MDILNNEECKAILEKAIPNQDLRIINFRFENIIGLIEGFLSDSKKLVIEFTENDDDIQREMCFFAKIFPQKNDFHSEFVSGMRGFEKEVFFFHKIKPNLDLFTFMDIIPKCYLAIPNKIVVLELLSDWKVKDAYQYFNEKDIKKCIESTAILHSASMMYESKSSLDLESIWGEYFFYGFYLRDKNHIGSIHAFNGVEALKAIINEHYPEGKRIIKEKVFDILDHFPELVQPSKKFRNVISHGDLYNNNIMFYVSTKGRTSTESSPIRDPKKDLVMPKETNFAEILPIKTENLIENPSNSSISTQASTSKYKSNLICTNTTEIDLVPNLAEISANITDKGPSSTGLSTNPLGKDLLSPGLPINLIQKSSTRIDPTANKITDQPTGKGPTLTESSAYQTKNSTPIGLPAKLIDFQLFRFNPPALDLLMMIYLTSDLTTNIDLETLIDYYYKYSDKCMKQFGFNISKELPINEFKKSIKHYKPLAIGLAFLFHHFVNLPLEVRHEIMEDQDKLKKFMTEDRRQMILNIFKQDENYRNKLITTMTLLFDSCNE